MADVLLGENIGQIGSAIIDAGTAHPHASRCVILHGFDSEPDAHQVAGPPVYTSAEQIVFDPEFSYCRSVVHAFQAAGRARAPCDAQRRFPVQALRANRVFRRFAPNFVDPSLIHGLNILMPVRRAVSRTEQHVRVGQFSPQDRNVVFTVGKTRNAQGFQREYGEPMEIEVRVLYTYNLTRLKFELSQGGNETADIAIEGLIGDLASVDDYRDGTGPLCRMICDIGYRRRDWRGNFIRSRH